MWKWFKLVSVALLIFAGCQPDATKRGCPCDGNCPINVNVEWNKTQCGPQGCPSQRPPIDIGDLPQMQQPSNYGFKVLDGHFRSVVRIACQTGDGNAFGSGVYVEYKGIYVVLTANHVTRDAEKIYVIFYGSAKPVGISAKWIGGSPDFDVSVLGLTGHPEDAEDIVAEMAFQDDLVTFKTDDLHNAGYDRLGILSSGTGQVKGFTSPGNGLPSDWFVLSTKSLPGDSGGPVFNSDNKVVGVLWGSDFETETIATYAGRLHVILNDVIRKYGKTQLVQPRPLPRQPKKLGPALPLKPPVLPWRDKIENEINGLKKQIQPRPPIVKPDGPKVDVEVTPKPKKEETKADRPKVDRSIAVCIICVLALVACAAGVAYAWKKSYEK